MILAASRLSASKNRRALLPFDECGEAYKVHGYHKRDQIGATIGSQPDPVPMMKSSLDHIPHRKQQELARALEILHEEFEDALGEGTADFKKRGRILKIILFGSYARGTFVDEPHTMKGYRSDFGLLVIVNNRKLTDHATYWYKAADRIIRDSFIETPTQFIVHSLREVNTELKKGHYFFSDIRKEGIILYELDDEPLAEPKLLTAEERLEVAREHFNNRYAFGAYNAKLAMQAVTDRQSKHAAFLIHQTLEQAYACVLLTLTNYGPASHNIKFLRSLAEEQDLRLAEAFPRDQHRQRAWFNRINEAYVKARYSKHFEISEEALVWLGLRTAHLLELVKAVCDEHIEKLERDVRMGGGESGQ
jgi:predicted nucleotidyltransferase/HEPN domain-containing protein